MTSATTRCGRHGARYAGWMLVMVDGDEESVNLYAPILINIYSLICIYASLNIYIYIISLYIYINSSIVVYLFV